MKLEYVKTADDAEREQSDIKTCPIQRYMKNQDQFRFNIGDILIKSTKWYGGMREWHTECTAGTGTPTKFMYVFENELGIGYIKQLKVDGTGFTNSLICTSNFDPDNVKLMLDPDYVDHILLGGDEEFQYNSDYLDKKAFRLEAAAKNKKLLIGTQSVKTRLVWFHGLKVGDIFWCGSNINELEGNHYCVTSIRDDPKDRAPKFMQDDLANMVKLMPSYRMITVEHNGDKYNTMQYTQDHFAWRKVTATQPHPSKDPLCGPQK